MSKPSILVAQCPGCAGALKVTRLGCDDCAMQLEGQFQIPALLHLSANDLAFVIAFVRSSGSLKAMAATQGQSYPTIRNRLDRIIAKLGDETDPEAERHAILDALAKGDLTPAEAAKRLKEIR